MVGGGNAWAWSVEQRKQASGAQLLTECDGSRHGSGEALAQGIDFNGIAQGCACSKDRELRVAASASSCTMNGSKVA